MKQFIIHICVIALWLDATVPAETCVENCIIRCNSLSGAHVCLRCSDTASSYVHALSSTAVPAASEQLTPELFTRGRTHEYTGKYLEAISMPLGGIGGGNVQTNGKAQLQSWQIFNNYDPLTLPNTFFAVRVALGGGRTIMRALQTEQVGPFAAMDSLTFRGEYPFGWFDFKDASLPVDIRLETFSPLIPMNAKDSAIPCALFNMSVKNSSNEPVDVSFLASQQNGVGYRTPANRIGWGPANLPGINDRIFPSYGANLNRIIRQQHMTALHMTANSSRNVVVVDMTLAVVAEEVTGTASWKNLEDLIRDFTDDGEISGPRKMGPTPKGETLNGALACRMTIAPGATKTVTFLLTWYFPNGSTTRAPNATDRQSNWFKMSRMYCNWWLDSLDVAGYLQENLNRITNQTRAYHDAFYETNLPYWLLDRISSQTACLRSQTCFWDKDGYFGGWEGCLSTKGCCKGNCSHVWHYVQAHARLFPSIGRKDGRAIFLLSEPSRRYPNAPLYVEDCLRWTMR